MSRLLSTVGAIALGSLVGGSLLATPVMAQQTVTVGAIEILSGPSAAYGTAIKGGLELAMDEINAAGGVLGGKKIALIIEDSAGNKDQAVNAARKLVGRDKVPVVIGPTLSNEMFAVGPVTNERKVVTVGTSTTAKGITEIGPYIFRTSLPESDVVPVTLKTAKEKFGVKTIAMMYANDDAFSKSGFDSMKAAAEQLGLTIATIETFGSKDTDFSAQLTKIKGLNVDAITISALVEPISGVVLQARQLGIPRQRPLHRRQRRQFAEAGRDRRRRRGRSAGRQPLVHRQEGRGEREVRVHLQAALRQGPRSVRGPGL